MGRLKSLVIKAELDTALKSHNCQANDNHRISKGESRLKVSNGRSYNYYCIMCAKHILATDIKKLQTLEKHIDS